MKCSVVMTTYNGSRFVRRQLESIRNQTRQAAEVVIFDDGSTDDTVYIVREYIKEYDLANWSININPHNLGWKANFIQALDKAQGDILFPCDQDDEWNPQKIELMAAGLEDNKAIDILACDTEIKYEKGAVKSRHYHGDETNADGQIVQYPLTTSFFMNPRPGCTYAIRKTFFDRIKNNWQKDFPHDEYMWIAAALSGGAYLLNRKLVEFHRHAENNSDIRYKDIEMQKKQLDYIGRSLTAFEQLIKNKSIIALPQTEKLLNDAQIWCSKRKQLMKSRNPFIWFSMAPWWKYYNSRKNALSDLYLVLFGKFRR